MMERRRELVKKEFDDAATYLAYSIWPQVSAETRVLEVDVDPFQIPLPRQAPAYYQPSCDGPPIGYEASRETVTLDARAVILDGVYRLGYGPKADVIVVRRIK